MTDRSFFDELHALSSGPVSEETPPSPEPPSPEQLRDEGARAAENSLDTRWRLWAEAELDKLISSHQEFTADDLRLVVGDPPDGRHVNGVGGLFVRASQAGRLLMVGYRPSTRAEARGRVLRVWRGAA